MQSSEYGAMVAPSNLNVESGGFNVLLNFLGSSILEKNESMEPSLICKLMCF